MPGGHCVMYLPGQLEKKMIISFYWQLACACIKGGGDDGEKLHALIGWMHVLFPVI